MRENNFELAGHYYFACFLLGCCSRYCMYLIFFPEKVQRNEWMGFLIELMP